MRVLWPTAGSRPLRLRDEMTRSNDELERAVQAELHWNPRLDDAGILVAADDGRVTLRGEVATFQERKEAGRATERIDGVRAVTNELSVDVRTKHVQVEVSRRDPKAVELDGPVRRVLRKAKRAVADHPLLDDY